MMSVVFPSRRIEKIWADSSVSCVDADGFFFFLWSEDRGRRGPSGEGVPIVRCTPSAPNKAALYSCSWFLIYFVSLSL